MRLRLPAIGMAIALLVAACGSHGHARRRRRRRAASARRLGRSIGRRRRRARPAGSVLRVARLADHYNFWHPVQFQTGNQFQWWSNVFNTLVEAEADSKTVIGDLAETFDVSPDATVYTFHLVDNAKWHDGEAFTADDVMFTINWTVQNCDAFKGFLPAWNQIKGADAVLGTTNTPEGLKKIDDSTVEITLAAPNAAVPLQHHRHGQHDPAGAHPQGRHQGRRREDRLHGRQARRHDRDRPLQAHQLHRRPVGRARRQPRLLQGRPEDRQDHLQALRRPGARRRPARVGRPRPRLPRLPGRVRPAVGDRHAERHLGREPGHHPDRVQDRGGARGATSGSARRSTPRSTARRSSTTSTRAGRRSSTTRPASRSTTTSTSTSTTSTRPSSCWPTAATRARPSSSSTTRPSPTPRRSCRSSRATCRPPA